MRNLIFLLALLSSVPTFSAPREFCEGEFCAPDTLSVRFGDRFGPTAFHAGDHVPIGQEMDVVVTVRAESLIQSFSLGVAMDPDEVEILSAELSEEVRELNPFFDEIHLAVGRGDDLNSTPETDPTRYGVVAATFIPNPGPARFLPVGSNVPLLRAKIRVVGNTLPIELEFTDDLVPNIGAPQTATNFTINGASRPPALVEDGSIQFGIARRRFRRGDVNGDGRISIADPVLIVQATFEHRALTFDCDDMLDVDDDGTLTTSDPIALLRWMFLGEPSPLEQFPACDGDPTPEDPLLCPESNCS